MVARLAQAKRTRGPSLSLIPVFLVVLCVIGSMAIIAQRAAIRQEAIELEREKRQLSLSLMFEAEALLQNLGHDEALGELFQNQNDSDRVEKTLGTVMRRHGADFAILIKRGDGALVAEKGEPETLAARADLVRRLIATSTMRAPNGSILGIGREARVLNDGAQALELATLPLGRSLVLVVVRPLTSSLLRRLSNVLDLPELRLMRGEEDTKARYLLSSIDGVQMSLVWTPHRQATETLGELSVYGGLAAFVVAIIATALFRSIRNSTADILKREARASFEAAHDALSGLPNRAVFCDTLERDLAALPTSQRQIAVLLLDLDKFKQVNDTYGHAAGDHVLRAFGQRVRALLRQADMIARLGGDEFAILLRDARGQKEVGVLAQSIIDAAAEPFTRDGIPLRVGVSVGVAFAPEDGLDMASVLRAADTALYRAKNEGRNRFTFYEHRMTEAERMRKLVDDELRGAIENDELALVYQPQIHAETGKIASVEALVRWRHPQHGMISPALFVAAAEERNLIVPLGDWVLRRACRDAARWPHLRVAVNVSAIQFRQEDFVAHVLEITKTAGLTPSRIELELTEGVLVEDADQAEAAMMALRNAGFRLALDDFGTGYASLIYLRRFAFDKIKIDKSFLDTLEGSDEGAILVHSVVHLGRALGLEVTAEGVETEEQHRFLKALGCHFLQGYLFSKPVSADAIDAMLLAEEEPEAPLRHGAA